MAQTILIVDDDPVQRRLLEALVARFGYQAITADGGESPRPGASPVATEEEIVRVVPIVRALASKGLTVSIDTRKPVVMAAALEAGARIVNDVTALGDPESAPVVVKRGASALLMHMQGEPATMQDNPTYDDAALDVYDFLEARVRACEAAGIPAERLAVDPGIGFGKTKVHNAEILGALSLYHGLGCGLMIGVSRKAFVGGPEGRLPPSDRLPGSLAAALAAVAQESRSSASTTSPRRSGPWRDGRPSRPPAGTNPEILNN